MNEYELNFNTFMGGWFMPESVIEGVLKWAEKKSSMIVPGRVSGGILKDLKDSMDIIISPDNNEPEIIEYRNYLQECLILYLKKYEDCDTSNNRFNIIEKYQYQKYKPGGGFKVWHNERGNLKNSKRLLVFMTYLNDVEDGGTHFKNFDLTTPAKKGLTLIWPTDWPWMHKGQISTTKEKHIITGWFSFYE
jgi:prolyl 4-hydroxylase